MPNYKARDHRRAFNSGVGAESGQSRTTVQGTGSLQYISDGSPGASPETRPAEQLKLERADGKRIAFSEITIGTNRSVEETREQLARLLKEAGYKGGDEEYPEIRMSAMPFSDHSPPAKQNGS